MNPNQQKAAERRAMRVLAMIFFLVLAVIGGLNPFDHTTIFWVSVLAFWVCR